MPSKRRRRREREKNKLKNGARKVKEQGILLSVCMPILEKPVYSIRNRRLQSPGLTNGILGSFGSFWPDSDQKLA